MAEDASAAKTPKTGLTQAETASLYGSALSNTAQTFATIANAVTAEKQRRAAERASAASYRQQAQLYSQQAYSYMAAAKLSAQNAQVNAEIGEQNARQTRLRASYIQQYEDFNLQASRKQRRALIAQGRVNFVANGILLEAREGAATSIWEADEEADAAIERINIMQQAEDEAYGYLVGAQQALVSGYSSAASSAADAAAQASNAVSSAMQATQATDNAIAAERAARKKNRGGVIGSAVGAAIGAVAGIALAAATGGLSLAATGAIVSEGANAGASIGSSIGNL